MSSLGRLASPALLLALSLWSLGPAQAEAPDAEGPAAAMAQTVLDQLAAFRRGDWAGAYAFAAEPIKARFTLAAFQEMVTRGYGPIARSARGTVRRTEVLDPQHGLVEVRVEGQDGQVIEAVYELVEEQGMWRIAGVLARPVEAEVTAGVPAPPGRAT